MFIVIHLDTRIEMSPTGFEKPQLVTRKDAIDIL